ncbi:MAG TPA: endonuclease/exonuclease/phosphatase family protein [Stellaceae bacterium]|nr:endonuclease/exonuclease/phosphatase family protein [Stellaceae bacterium]
MLRIATYNIHGCVGVDRRYEPERIAAVLREIDADVTCLQEVGTRRATAPHEDQATYLAEATGRRLILGGGPRGRRGRFANAILTRFPVVSARAIDLAVWVYEPRAALDVELMIGGRTLRVVATHFGLHAGERRWQADRLIAALREPSAAGRKAADAVLLVGDLNEWRGRSGGIRALDRCLGPSAAPRTFPSWMPVLPLDRIYADGPAVLRDVHVYRSPQARLASDHLPLIGSLWWTEHAADRRAPPLFPYGNPAGAGLGAIATG